MENMLASTSIAGLFGVMVVMAAIPSLSVLLVTTRAASSGLEHGIAVASGIVVADLVFVVLAILGLSLLAEGLGSWFVYFKYAAGLYLIWLAVRLWRKPAMNRIGVNAQHDALWSSFASGVLLTLSDQKALLFYFALLPAFIDMAHLSRLDVIMIVTVTILAVGGVKTGYAYLGARTRYLTDLGSTSWINNSAAGVLLLIGFMVMLAV